MNTYSCYIVEDDPQALEFGLSILNQDKEIQVVGNSDSIDKAVNDIKALKPDFIILDVFLTDGTGLDLLRRFPTIDFKIIFTTSFAKYAIDAFKFSAIDYLLKPYAPEELETALQKIKDNISGSELNLQLKTLIENWSQKELPKKIVLKDANAMHVVDIETILFIEADNYYSTFYLSDNSKIVVSKSLKLFDKKLECHGFFRAHQSYLVNLDFLSSFDKSGSHIILKNKKTIPVAQSKRKKLMILLDSMF